MSNATTFENPFLLLSEYFFSSKVLMMRIEIGIECNIFRPWMFNPIFCFKECINLKHPNTFTLSNMQILSYLMQHQTILFSRELLFSVNSGVDMEARTSCRHISCHVLYQGPRTTWGCWVSYCLNQSQVKNPKPRLLDFVVENLWKGKMNCSLLLFGVIGYVHASPYPHGGLILRF